MSDMVKIDFAAIEVQKPLPWPVYDGTGKLLLYKGYVIESQAQIDSLIARGVYRSQGASTNDQTAVKAKKLSPFAELEAIAPRLDKAYGEISAGNPHGIQTINSIVDMIIMVVKNDDNACIGAIHLYAKNPTHTEHALFYALLCQLMSPALNLDEEGGKRLLFAALTANISLRQYQDKLHNLKSKLTEKQRALIEKHPEQSSQLLKKAGCADATLIAIIQQHHESLQGDGYPKKLSGDEIRPCSRLLLACEHYVAKVSGRAYRSACKTNEALRDLYRHAGQDTKEPIYLHFIKALSVYPPGSFVRLKNGEIAIITHRAHDKKGFQMKAILSPRGGAYMGSFKRDSLIAEHHIEETVHPEHLPALNLPDLWGY